MGKGVGFKATSADPSVIMAGVDLPDGFAWPWRSVDNRNISIFNDKF